MADLNDLWIQITAESDDIEDSAPVDGAKVKTLIAAHNLSETAHADIREQLRLLADKQTEEIKEYASKREFPLSGDTSVTIYVDVSTGNLYRYNTSARQYEALAMDSIPNSVALEGIPTAPTARTGTNTTQIATTAFVQNELAQIREQSETAAPVYYDSKTKTKLSLLGADGTIVTNVADGKVERGSSDAVTGGQLWSAQQDMANMSALAARNIAANSAEIELLKNSVLVTTEVVGTNVDVSLEEADGTRTFTLTVPVNGSIAEGNTGIVSGGAVYEALQNGKEQVQAGNGITVTDGVIAIDDTVATKEDLQQISLSNQFKIINGDHTAAMLGEAEGQPTYAINVRANGSIQKNDGRIVTGGTVYEEIRLNQDGHIVKENNTAAQNIAALDAAIYETIHRIDAIPEAMEMADTVQTLQTDTEALRNDVSEIQDSLVNVLDKDLATLSNEGKQVIRTLSRDTSMKIINGDHTVATIGEEDGNVTYAINVRANGAVAAKDNRIITGQTVFNEVRVEEDGTVIESTATTGANLKALDDAYTELNHRVDIIAGEAPETQYKAGDFIAVSDDRIISVKVNGAVEDNNAGLVTGDQVADALRNVETTSRTLIDQVHDELVNRMDQLETLNYTAGEGISLENRSISLSSSVLDQINNAASAEYATLETFPVEGEESKLYVDTETNSLYRWDSAEAKYKEIQGNTINDCVTGIERDGDQLQITKADSSVTSVPLHSPLTNEEIDTLF